MSLPFWRKRAPIRQAPAPVPPVVSQPPTTNLQPPTPSAPIRVTDERDGIVLNRGYSYYSAAFVEPPGTILAFCGVVGKRPQFFRVDLDGSISRLGDLVPYGGEAEGWYFDREGYLYLCDGPRLQRVHPITKSDTVVLDISATRPGCDLWQAHSSDDGRTHSATVRQIVDSGTYPKIATVVSRNGELIPFDAEGDLDESHVTADGYVLIIEESDGNRIIDLATRTETRVTNAQGALAHIDCGADFAIGEDDQRGACTYLDVRTMQRRVLFDTWQMGHVSVRGRRCLHTNATVLRLIDLESWAISPVCGHGMVGTGYDFQCHANLSPDGRAFAFVSNAAGRNDLYVGRLP